MRIGLRLALRVRAIHSLDIPVSDLHPEVIPQAIFTEGVVAFQEAHALAAWALGETHGTLNQGAVEFLLLPLFVKRHKDSGEFCDGDTLLNGTGVTLWRTHASAGICFGSRIGGMFLRIIRSPVFFTPLCCRVKALFYTVTEFLLSLRITRALGTPNKVLFGRSPFRVWNNGRKVKRWIDFQVLQCFVLKKQEP